MINKLIGSFILITLASNCWSASLADNGDGTVTDFDTGLVWQQQDDNIMRTQGNAISYCNGLALDGKSDWRLPQIKELTSIVDYRVTDPSIDDALFPGTNLSSYWSASSFASNSADAWNVDFGFGFVFASVKTDSRYVRCVR